MKISIWIRPDMSKPREMTLRVDCKYENLDTPNVHRWGRRLMDAIESGGERTEGGK